MQYRVIFILIFLLFIPMACTTGALPTDPGKDLQGLGSVSLIVSFGNEPAASILKRAPAGDFTTGWATLSNGTNLVKVALIISGNKASAQVSRLAAGTWGVTLQFFNASGDLTFSGTGSVTVLNGKVTPVMVTVNPVGGDLQISVDLPVDPHNVWQQVGNGGWGQVPYSFGIDGTQPYICFNEGTEIRVKTLQDDLWVELGDASLQGYWPNLALNGSAPCVLFMGADGLLHVKEFRNGAWVSWGAGIPTEAFNLYSLYLKFDAGVPYVAFRDFRLKVYAWDGGKFAPVGGVPTVNQTNVRCLDVVVSGGVPWVAYYDVSDWYALNVKKWNGSAWELIGAKIPDCDTMYAPRIGLSGGTPFVIYRGHDAHPYVKRWNGLLWEPVGTVQGGGSPYGIGLMSIAFSGSTPYIAFHDYASSRAVVRRWNGVEWADVGVSGGVTGPINNGWLEFQIDGQGTPYVFVWETALGGVVKKFIP